MKKRLVVKRKHRYSKESDLMYKGIGEFTRKDDCIKLQYQEENNDVDTNVEVFAYADHLILKRHGETDSELHFNVLEDTKGVLTSIYGTIEIMIHTYKYIRKDTVITLEYDIETGGSEPNGYHILWSIKEETR